jgi:WD40 repeat protein
VAPPTPNNLTELAQRALPTGVVDYFALVGPVRDEVTLQLGEAAILARFPEADRPNEPPLTEKLEWFCFPTGVEANLPSSALPDQPSSRTFVFKHSGTMSYGIGIVFYLKRSRRAVDLASVRSSYPPRPPDLTSPRSAEVQERAAINESTEDELWAPLCLCLLTRVPVVQALQRCLIEIYDQRARLLPNTYDDLFERGGLAELLRSHIVELTLEVPLPIPGAVGVGFSFLGADIYCSLPGPTALPPLSFPLATLLQTFSPRNIIALVGAALCQHRILLHSRELALLPIVADSIIALMYPLTWQAPYFLPMPKRLFDDTPEIVEAFMGCVVGIHTDWLATVNPASLSDVFVVDCDSGRVRIPHRDMRPPSLPESVAQHLHRAIRQVVAPALGQMDLLKTDLDTSTFRCKRISSRDEYELRLIFARCMAYLLSSYQECIFWLEQAQPYLIRDRFLSEYVPRPERDFMDRLINTQSFQFFMENHETPYLEFFRRLVYRAQSRAQSRAGSPSGPGIAPGKTPADFQLVYEPESNDWLGHASDDVLDAPHDVMVKLSLRIPAPPTAAGKESGEPRRPSKTDGQGGGGGGDSTPKGFKFAPGALEDRWRRRASAPILGASHRGGGEEKPEEERPVLEKELSTGRAIAPLVLPSLIPSPGKGDRRSNSLGAFELDVILHSTVSPARFGDKTQVVPPTIRSAADWREPRQWTIGELAEIMGITVKELADAMGLNFDLQRVMTRGHTMFAFAEASSMGMEPMSASASSASDNLSEDYQDLMLLLRQAFSGSRQDRNESRSPRHMEMVFRKGEIRARFLSVLAQARSKRGPYQQGGPAGTFRVMGSAFEALMQLASAMCNVCAEQKDYTTAYELLQQTGKYYQVLEGGEAFGWTALRNEGAQHKEFLASRLRHHEIFKALELWLVVMREQSAQDVLPGGASRAPVDDQEGDGREMSRSRRIVTRAKELLKEMSGIGLSAEAAQGLVRTTIEEYRLTGPSRQSLEVAVQRIWRTSEPTRQPASTRPPGAQQVVSVNALEERGGEPGELRRRVSFSDRSESGLSRMPPLPPRRTNPADVPVETPHLPNIGSGMTVQQFAAAPESSAHKGPVLSLDVDAAGTLAVSGGADKLVVIYSIPLRRRIMSFTGHAAPVTCVKAMQDADGSPLLVSASLDATLRLWHLSPSTPSSGYEAPGGTLLSRFTTSRHLRCILAGHSQCITCVEKHQAQGLLATGSLDATVKLWSAARERCEATLSGHGSPVTCVSFGGHASAPHVVSTGRDGLVIKWDVREGREKMRCKGHLGSVKCLQPLSSEVVATGSSDQTVRVWDTRVQNSIHCLTGHRGTVTCIQGSGSVLSDESSPLLFTGSTDATVKVWDLRSPDECIMSLDGHTEVVTCLAARTRGGFTRLVSAGEDRRVLEWDARTGALLRKRLGDDEGIRGHRDGISCMKICGDDTVVTGSWDHTVMLWPSSSTAGQPSTTTTPGKTSVH